MAISTRNFGTTTQCQDLNVTQYRFGGLIPPADGSTFPPFLIMGVLLGLACLFGLVFNLLSLSVVSKEKYLHSTTFILYLFLGISDSFLLVCCALFGPIRFSSAYVDGGSCTYEAVWIFMEPFIIPLTLTAMTFSNWIVALKGVDRYLSVCHPLKSNTWCTVGRVKRVTPVAAICAIALNVPWFFRERTVSVFDDGNCTGGVVGGDNDDCGGGADCVANIIYGISASDWSVSTHVISVVVLTFILPFGVLLFCNAKFVIAMRKTNARMTAFPEPDDYFMEYLHKFDSRITKLLFISVLVYLISQLPFGIMMILSIPPLQRLWIPDLMDVKWAYLTIISMALTAIQPASNSFLFYVFAKRFRKILNLEMGKCFASCCCRKRDKMAITTIEKNALTRGDSTRDLVSHVHDISYEVYNDELLGSI